jgi:hypothetical protein
MAPIADTEEPLYTETYYPWFFFPYSVTVTKSHVSFGYYFGLFSMTVDRSKISHSLPLTDVKGFREWGGWGIRLRRCEGKWETGYIAKNGGAVKIKVLHENSDDVSIYVFTCSEPDKVCDILNGKS